MHNEQQFASGFNADQWIASDGRYDVPTSARIKGDQCRYSHKNDQVSEIRQGTPTKDAIIPIAVRDSTLFVGVWVLEQETGHVIGNRTHTEIPTYFLKKNWYQYDTINTYVI